MADPQGIPVHVSWLMQQMRTEGAEPSLVQTHVSYVLLAGEDVYKFKKPVRFDFVDHTTLEARRRTCENEVRLNSRLCGELYHGVLTVARSGDGFTLAENPDGDVVDYCVHMKRLPAEPMLDNRLERGEVTFDMIGAIAGKMAAFHHEAERSAEITAIGGYETFVRNWNDNFHEAEAIGPEVLPDATLQRIEAFVHRSLDRLEPLLKRREDEGHVVDGHGDLRADAIWVDPADERHICIFDCLEFNERFRYSDSGLDIAFLAMDLEAKGRADLASLLIAMFCQSAGEVELPVLVPLFVAYRAFVRGKVRSLFALQDEVSPEQRRAARAEARSLFELAAASADVRRTHGIIMVCGLTGSGKSTVAGALAARTGSVIVSTDVARKRLADARPSQRLAADSYSETMTQRVYTEVRDMAAAALDRGFAVFVDGTFSRRQQRKPLVDLARRLGVPLLVVECRVADEVIKERQEHRAAHDWRVSDATYDVYLRQKAAAEPFDDVPVQDHLVLDTTLPLEDQLSRVLDHLP